MRAILGLLACGLVLGGCASWKEAFRGAETIKIWDARVVGGDDTRLSRHAVALSDAQALIGVSQTGSSNLAFVWRRDGRSPDYAACQGEAPAAACRQPRWTYSLEMVTGADGARPTAPGRQAVTLVHDRNVVLVEPLNRDVYQRLVVEHVRERVAQIDHLCLGYFSGLERLASGSNATRDGIGVLANYGSILLALSESATKPLAILAGTRAALDGGLTAAETLLLLNPAPMQTYRLVKASQEKALAEARIEGFTRYTDAAAFIEGYAYDCTPLGIRRIISETIEEEVRRIDPAATSGAGQVLLNQMVVAVNSDEDARNAYGGAPLATLTSQDAAYLALLLEQWECTEATCLSQAVLLANAPATLKPLLTPPAGDARGAWTLSPQSRAQLRQLLGALAVVQPSFPTLKAETLTRITPPATETPASEEDQTAGEAREPDADDPGGTGETNSGTPEDGAREADADTSGGQVGEGDDPDES
jgi:hypothetical protein